MSKTINGTYTSTIKLTSAADNPVTITAGSLVEPAFSGGDAIDGSGLAWSITNFGTVFSPTGAGISLTDGGKITNGSAAAAKALIVGGTAGIQISGAAGTVANLGLIQTAGSGESYGVKLNAGGSVTNGSTSTTTAAITGDYVGVKVKGRVGTITNFGQIAGVVGFGVQLENGGSVTNGSSASQHANISGSIAGISTLGGAATVTNFGAITSHLAGVFLKNGGKVIQEASANITSYVVGVAMGIPGQSTSSGGGSLTQAAGGVITGAVGVVVGGKAGTVSNDGEIFGLGGLNGHNTVTYQGFTISLGFGVVLAAGGKLTNLADGSITGEQNDGVFVTSGSVNNAGRISGTVGVLFSSTGTLNNTGTISSNSGTAGTAVSFGGGNDMLVIGLGSDLVGKVLGGTGSDTVKFTHAGAKSLTGFSGFETIDLASGAKNTLTLNSANFTGVTATTITVNGGNNGNTISEASVSATSDIAVMIGGTAADTLIAGSHATMTGGGGADLFEFAFAGGAGNDSNTVTAFVHSTDKLVFSNKAFSLGFSNATATPKALTASLFSTSASGAFSNSTQRFSYNKSTGQLFYDSDGNGSSPRHLIATLTGHPTMTASDLFYVT